MTACYDSDVRLCVAAKCCCVSVDQRVPGRRRRVVQGTACVMTESSAVERALVVQDSLGSPAKPVSLTTASMVRCHFCRPLSCTLKGPALCYGCRPSSVRPSVTDVGYCS